MDRVGIVTLQKEGKHIRSGPNSLFTIFVKLLLAISEHEVKVGDTGKWMGKGASVARRETGREMEFMISNYRQTYFYHNKF